MAELPEMPQFTTLVDAMAQLAQSMECEPLSQEDATALLEHLLFSRNGDGRRGRGKWSCMTRGVITELELRNLLMAHSTTEIARKNGVDEPKRFKGDIRELGRAFEIGLYGREAQLQPGDNYDHVGSDR